MMPEYIVKDSEGMFLMEWRALGICAQEDGAIVTVYCLIFGDKRSKAHVFNSLWKPKEIIRGHRDVEIVQIRQHA